MALFKFKKKKEKPDFAKAPAVAVAEDYLNALRREAVAYLPTNPTAQHLETVFSMLDKLLPFEVVRLEMEVEVWKKAQQKEQNGEPDAEQTTFLAFAESGFHINRYLGAFNDEYIGKAIASAEKETLLKAFIAADYYAYHLNTEAKANLVKLQQRIAREMLHRGYTVFVSCEPTES